MKHIRYMTSNKPVCEKPDMLGSDFVVLDYSPGDYEWCDPCLQLVTAHNKRQYEQDRLINYPQGHNVSSGASLMKASFGLASLFWIIVMFVVVLILSLEC